MTVGSQEIVLGKHCPWMVSHPYDWFYQAPAILVLCVNVVFLVMIMWVSGRTVPVADQNRDLEQPDRKRNELLAIAIVSANRFD